MKTAKRRGKLGTFPGGEGGVGEREKRFCMPFGRSAKREGQIQKIEPKRKEKRSGREFSKKKSGENQGRE